MQLAHKLGLRSIVPLVALVAIAAAVSPDAQAEGMQCNGQCGWTASVDGVEVGSGWYGVDSSTGDIALSAPIRIDLQDGGFIGVDSMNGNIDPILGFSVAGGTGAAGRTFAFNFSLPVALSGSIYADSQVSYTLTSLSSAGAQITPLFGHVVTAQEVDTSIGGLAPLNKGVDVGNTFSVSGGPTTLSSPTYSAVNFFNGSLDYDLMSVTVAFSLSANSQVGVSGFVQQTPAVPVPAALPLLLSGLAGLFGIRRLGRCR